MKLCIVVREFKVSRSSSAVEITEGSVWAWKAAADGEMKRVSDAEALLAFQRALTEDGVLEIEVPDRGE
jgi:hypothetical protein